MTDGEDGGGTCAVCGVPLDDDSWWVELNGPDCDDELHTCSQEHAAAAVASWVPPPPLPADGPPRLEVGEVIGCGTALLVVLAVLGLLGLGGYQLLQMLGVA
ncbi:hypothetical protein [Pseudokineococcus lusitanus]|uniref:Uncharacterized protein n=1 Tax=Pseudokineococcus lusitanus TaxID=763993 RepID=A0A3N1GAP0_9ACTN|nr:hypothetical protein [Pseudokineococcus lusitanus]ROP27299.1 hypothetical protein EDC03_2824 [Pseudokineococcus lusitanus]